MEEYIQNLKTQFGNFNYALDDTLFEPMKYMEYLSNMTAPETLSKTTLDLAVDFNSPEYSPIHPAAKPAAEKTLEIPSLNLTKRSATEETLKMQSVNPAKKLASKHNSVISDQATVKTTNINSSSFDGENKLKAHLEGIMNICADSQKKVETLTVEKNQLSQKLKQLEGYVIDLKQQLQLAENEKNQCIICDQECFKFCGIVCMK